MATKPGLPEILSFGDTGYGDELLSGLALTLFIAVMAYALGLLIGMIGAMGKIHGSPLTQRILLGYTTLVRAVPELVLILILYFAGSTALSALFEALGFGAVAINGIAASIVVLGFVQGAYHTEVLRGAIQAIPIGQLEAARAYGMSPILEFRRVTLPAMLPLAIPGLSNLWLIVTKDTALIAVVGGGVELAKTAQQAAGNTKMYMTFFLTAGAIYLTITLLSQQVLSRFERHLRRGQRLQT
ncbi:MAG TPA: ABC transporter permease subunit [Aestuariivirga sp.]|nr:ABC transporter permease subunit [Alphaproteobacteria bacterium]HRX35260.1 ABC transporter permease subunit [Aestuariivirga sp.]